jgi:hypothetical protein
MCSLERGEHVFIMRIFLVVYCVVLALAWALEGKSVL